ncbi:MAG: VENN motif pre-toxin domain-containing protein, partial [Neisseriaceae bacterium]|nr:VENN motif pre-toxin domain-containing protein [Neisseriaceae bacterium]
MQNEIDLQVKVTQEFDNNLKQLDRLQNQRLDKLKAQKDVGEIDEQEYNRQAETIQNQKLIAKMLGAGLLSPADNVLGVATSAVSPAISYEIGQYFKAHNAENTPAHIATHAILGAIVSGANGGNALSGAISAGGAEAITPIITTMLYGNETKPENLTAEQKQTVSTVAQTIGVLSGSVTGDSSVNAYIGGTVASNAVENNSTVGQAQFATRHPKIAIEIGQYKDPTQETKPNISTIAGTFQ